MKAGYEPVQLSVPGLTEPSDEVWDVERYVEWLRAQIGTEKAPIVVGHSNGGRIAMAYDLAYPGHLQQLILIDSAGIYHDSLPVRLKRRLSKVLSVVLRPFIRGALRRVLYRVIGGSDYGNAPENMKRTLVNVTTFDKTFALEDVSVPITLIWGDHDKATPLSDAYAIQSRVQQADELHVVLGAGHSPHADAPEQTVTHIVTAIKGSE